VEACAAVSTFLDSADENPGQEKYPRAPFGFRIAQFEPLMRVIVCRWSSPNLTLLAQKLLNVSGI